MEVGVSGDSALCFQFCCEPKTLFPECVCVCVCAYVLLTYSRCVILYKLQMYNTDVCIDDSVFKGYVPFVVTIPVLHKNHCCSFCPRVLPVFPSASSV